jgi:hypothetical protein
MAFTATKDLPLPTTVTGSWPRPRWYTMNLWGRPLDTAMMDPWYREQFSDAHAIVVSDQLRAGLVLSDQQIEEQTATHGGAVVVLTRAYGGEWQKQLDRALRHPKVVGACLESPDPAVGNSPRFLNACAIHGKRAYILLGGDTQWTVKQIRHLLTVVPGNMASPSVYMVISDYGPRIERAKWYGTTNCVQANVAEARRLAERFSGAAAK